MHRQIQPVILCGGSGTRLWPLSRTGFPKQFLCLTGEDSLFQQAIMRLAVLKDAIPPIIVTEERHRFMVMEQLRELQVEAGAIILEPIGKNTAPALTLAAFTSVQQGEDPILVVTPADQVITDEQEFARAIELAIVAAIDGEIVTLGVKPERAETGYGYIKAGVSGDIRDVSCFVEKPNEVKAAEYLAAGNYFWNAGIFVLKASVWLAALERFRPAMVEAVHAAYDKHQYDRGVAGTFIRPDKVAFEQVPSESIDYAVMEHCPGTDFNVKVVPFAAGWSDLGSWESVWKTLPKDEYGNAHIGDVTAVDCKNTLVHANHRLVATVGLENVVVVETADAVLVADNKKSQEVKAIVSSLNRQKREEQSLHRKVHRPWGWYDSIDEGPRFKVKRIQVKPGASLSLQMHHHRAEHWIVVKGTAEIICGEQKVLLSENQSTYIPLGERHRLSNPGTIPLEIIEVQSGSYLGEDDIVRIEDVYGR